MMPVPRKLSGWRWLFEGLVFLFLIQCASAQTKRSTTSVRVGWNPPPAALSNITYRVYYGVASGVYTNHNDAGSALTNTITGLVRGVTYYLAATDLENGVESGYSNEITYTPPLKKMAEQVPVLSVPLSLTRTNGEVLLSATGKPYQLYVVYATDDFNEWEVVGQVRADASGILEFLKAETGSARFYVIQAGN